MHSRRGAGAQIPAFCGEPARGHFSAAEGKAAGRAKAPAFTRLTAFQARRPAAYAPHAMRPEFFPQKRTPRPRPGRQNKRYMTMRKTFVKILALAAALSSAAAPLSASPAKTRATSTPLSHREHPEIKTAEPEIGPSKGVATVFREDKKGDGQVYEVAVWRVVLPKDAIRLAEIPGNMDYADLLAGTDDFAAEAKRQMTPENAVWAEMRVGGRATKPFQQVVCNFMDENGAFIPFADENGKTMPGLKGKLVPTGIGTHATMELSDGGDGALSLAVNARWHSQELRFYPQDAPFEREKTTPAGVPIFSRFQINTVFSLWPGKVAWIGGVSSVNEGAGKMTVVLAVAVPKKGGEESVEK